MFIYSFIQELLTVCHAPGRLLGRGGGKAGGSEGPVARGPRGACGKRESKRRGAQEGQETGGERPALRARSCSWPRVPKGPGTGGQRGGKDAATTRAGEPTFQAGTRAT